MTSIRWRRSAVSALLACAIVGPVAGCANPGPGAADAAAAAHDFVSAVAAKDGSAACALLSPDAAAALAEDQGTSCEQAVLAHEVAGRVSPAGPPTSDGEAKAFGRQAQVHLGGDVLFLAMSKHGWVVTAAGCTPRPHQPYDCAIEGS
jgi:hypothetical protein